MGSKFVAAIENAIVAIRDDAEAKADIGSIDFVTFMNPFPAGSVEADCCASFYYSRCAMNARRWAKTKQEG